MPSMLIRLLLASYLATAAAFQLPAARPPAARVALRAESPQMGLATIAAGANLASFGLYGSALLFKPDWLAKNVMMARGIKAPGWKFGDLTYSLAQYLGAVYLSQALRMVRALMTVSMLRTDLMGVGIIQLFLCLTSVGRLLGGIEKNEVTLSLPFGQGLMAALAFAGSASVA